MAAYARILIQKHKPDIVIFDPLLSYFGNDIGSQTAATEFFRKHLQPIQNETGVMRSGSAKMREKPRPLK
jgi:hypothetical protein